MLANAFVVAKLFSSRFIVRNGIAFGPIDTASAEIFLLDDCVATVYSAFAILAAVAMLDIDTFSSGAIAARLISSGSISSGSIPARTISTGEFDLAFTTVAAAIMLDVEQFSSGEAAACSILSGSIAARAFSSGELDLARVNFKTFESSSSETEQLETSSGSVLMHCINGGDISDGALNTLYLNRIEKKNQNVNVWSI